MDMTHSFMSKDYARANRKQKYYVEALSSHEGAGLEDIILKRTTSILVVWSGSIKEHRVVSSIICRGVKFRSD